MLVFKKLAVQRYPKRDQKSNHVNRNTLNLRNPLTYIWPWNFACVIYTWYWRFLRKISIRNRKKSYSPKPIKLSVVFLILRRFWRVFRTVWLLLSLLTHNWEVKLESFIGIRIDLTFVNAFVFVRDWLDNEEPVAGVDLMEHLEALVGDVDKLAHGN